MRREALTRAAAAVAALVGWGALALQLVLIIRNLGPALGLWRFAGYFTILTNIGVAAVATAIALGNRGPLASPRARLMAATAIVMVGFVYSVALRSQWDPTGAQRVADVVLHDVTPLLFLIVWAVSSHPRLTWAEIGWALLWPLVYASYALGRGAVDGWYAYWFLNPAEQAPGNLFASIIVMLCAFAAVAALLVTIDRWVSERPRCKFDNLIDEAGRESFPASDPPSWTLGEERSDRR